ncbi:MAG: hypothetical protein WBP85_12785 [Terracidiphilus sp.]
MSMLGRGLGRWLTCGIAATIWAAANGQTRGHGASGAQAEKAAESEQPRQLVLQATRAELAAAAADHSLWLYYEVDSKPRNPVIQWAAETRSGQVDRVLQQDGHTYTPEEQRARMESFIRDSGAQAKQRRGGQQDDKRATEMLNMLPNAFIWTRAKQEGTETVLHFRPDPNFSPPSWEARVFAGMAGDLIVDDEQHRIVSLRGKLINGVKFGWGLLGELDPGGTFDVERRQLAHGIWQITETHVHIQGHAILFHSISDQEDDVKSKFEELPENITLDQAEQKLLEK